MGGPGRHGGGQLRADRAVRLAADLRLGRRHAQGLRRPHQELPLRDYGAYYTTLHYTTLYYTILYFTILHYYTILYYTILYYTILYYTILYYTILYQTCAMVKFPTHPSWKGKLDELERADARSSVLLVLNY